MFLVRVGRVSVIGRFGSGMMGMLVVVAMMVVAMMVSRIGMSMAAMVLSDFIRSIMRMVHEGEMERVGEWLQRETEAYKGSQEHSGCFLSLLVNHLVEPLIPR